MRNLFSFTIILVALFLHSVFAEDTVKNTVPSIVIKADKVYQDKMWELRDEYLKAVQKEQDRFMKVLTRELDRLRLSDEETVLADKIAKTEDEKVKTALLSVASDKVKQAVSLTSYRESFLKTEKVVNDFLGNPIEPEPEGKLLKELLVGEWLIKELGESVTFTKEGTSSYEYNRAEQKGTWKEQKGVLSWTWVGSLTSTLQYDEKEKVWTCTRSDNKVFTLIKPEKKE